MSRINPIRLTVEGTYLSPEHYIMVKSKCEKIQNMSRINPIRLTVEGTYLSPEQYIMVKSKCEKFVEDLLANFDGVEFGFSEEIFTSIETEKSIKGEG